MRWGALLTLLGQLPVQIDSFRSRLLTGLALCCAIGLQGVTKPLVAEL